VSGVSGFTGTAGDVALLLVRTECGRSGVALYLGSTGESGLAGMSVFTGVTGVAGDLALLLVLAGVVLPCSMVKLLFLVTLVEAITYTLSTLGKFVAKHPYFCGNPQCNIMFISYSGDSGKTSLEWYKSQQAHMHCGSHYNVESPYQICVSKHSARRVLKTHAVAAVA
jgi:hypothetical protein